MTLTNALHLLRNPWGHPDEATREARLWAADKLEYLQRDGNLCPTCACLPWHHPCDESGTLRACNDPFHISPNVNGWTSVSERVPALRAYVVAWEAAGALHCTVAQYRGTAGWFGPWDEKIEVTHWRPLPVAPTSLPIHSGGFAAPQQKENP